MATNASLKKKLSPWGDEHPEKLSDTQSTSTIGLSQQLKTLVNPTGMLDQLFGHSSGESSFARQKKEAKGFRKSETLVFSRAGREENNRIREETGMLLNKLKEQVTLLEKSEKAFVNEVAKIKVEKVPPKAGIYYLRFFEWLISVVRQLRQKVEEGRTWLAAFSSRKKKRQGYWKMYKKHGTTFGLSHERSLATQTG